MPDTEKMDIDATDPLDKPYDETYRSGPVITRHHARPDDSEEDRIVPAPRKRGPDVMAKWQSFSFVLVDYLILWNVLYL